MNILDLITDPALLAPFFDGPSWDRWRAVLRAAFALPMAPTDLALFREVSGDRPPPRTPVRELVAVVGRGGGKDAATSAIAAHAAINVDRSRLRPGERGTVMVIANSKDQAAICLSYIRGYFEQVPLLAGMVESISADTITLNNGAEITVVANSLRAPRGRRIICVIFDEVGTWRSDESATPDFEVDAAVAPGLARHPGAMKILISSPYRRVGLLYERWKSCFAKDDDDTLVVQGPSLMFNETLDAAIIERELQKDRARAGAEYLAEWRDDLSSFVDRLLVESLIDPGVRERPYDPTIHNYIAFTDESGGQGQDSSTLSICHAEKDDRIVQDLIRIWKPPFSSTAVIAEKAAILKTFRIRKVIGDKWAGGIPPELYDEHHIRFEQSAKPKSDLYLDFLHILNSRRLLMLDEPTQIAELCALERKTTWGGRESIGHPQMANAHDDAINSLAGAATLAVTLPAPVRIGPETMQNAYRWLSGLPPAPGTAPGPMSQAVANARGFQFHSGRGRGQYQPASGPSWTRGRLY